MAKHNLVSILVPIYGVETYIERCVRSLMDQTYSDCEFIFVDDCTPDNSIAILEKTIEEYPLCKDRVKIIHHNYNRGLGAARMTGIDNSKGEFVTFVDSDDYVSPDYVEKMIDAIIRYDGDLVISSQSQQDNEIKYLDTIALLKSKLCRRTSCRIWGNLMRRSFMNKYHIFPIEGIDHAEDFHVMCRYISECEKIVSLNKKLYYYTIDNLGSYSRNYTDKSYYSILKSLKVTGNYLIQKNLNKYGGLVSLCYLEFYKWFICNCHTNKYTDIIYKMIKENDLSLLERTSLFLLSHHAILPAKIVLFLLYKRN